MLTILPLFHGFGLGVCVHTVLSGGLSSILVPQFSGKSFVRAIKKIVQNLDGELVRMESSETPTRSYVINFEHNEDYLESVRRNSDRQMSEIIDEVLDRVIE